MKIEKISLENFRNFERLTIQFTKPITLILAPNTSGKTNILEAIFYLASGHSPRAEVEQELIKRNLPFASIEGTVKNSEPLELRVFLQRNEEDSLLAKKRLEVNGVSRRLSNFLGNFRAVLFTPQDLNLITDSPSRRRKYLDTTLSQTHHLYHTTSTQYQKIITQRNKLLERIRDNQATAEQLYYWDDKLVKLGSEIYHARKSLLDYYAQEMKTIGPKIHGQEKDLEVMYYPNIVTHERLKSYQTKEINSAQTLLGPHRDDFSLYWKGYDLEKYGSRGEQRLGILALKIAELNYFYQKAGEKPVLLLDDIFSELDITHRKNLLQLFNSQQTILTSTEDEVYEILGDLKEVETICLKGNS